MNIFKKLEIIAFNYDCGQYESLIMRKYIPDFSFIYLGTLIYIAMQKATLRWPFNNL
jgi:hypothetical protein